MFISVFIFLFLKMPLVYCAVDSCPSRRGSGISFFRCPKDKTRCQIWKNQLGYTGNHRFANFTPDQCYEKIRICGKHFTNESFTTPEKHHLNINAKPTLLVEPIRSSRVSHSNATYIMFEPQYQDAEVQTETDTSNQSDTCPQILYNKNDQGCQTSPAAFKEQPLQNEVLQARKKVKINSSDEDDSSEDPLQIYVAQEESKKIDNDKTTKIISSENIPAKKRKVDEMSEEYNTLTKNEPDMFPKDEYSIFGELVAIKLRHLPSDYAKIVVQHIINTTLFHAQMGKYNNPPDLHNSSTSTGPQPDPYDYYMSNHLQEILPKISSTQPPSLQPYQHSTSSSESFVSESQPLMPTKTEALSDIE